MVGHVLLDTREKCFLSEFCVEEILLLELLMLCVQCLTGLNW